MSKKTDKDMVCYVCGAPAAGIVGQIESTEMKYYCRRHALDVMRKEIMKRQGYSLGSPDRKRHG